MDALHIDRAVTGGVSQGGFTALRTALLAPERIHGLVLFDTEAQACDPNDKIIYAGMFAALAENGPIDEILQPLAQQLIGQHPATEHWISAWRERYSLPLGPAATCLLERDDVAERLGEITCPALLIRGSDDPSLPRERMQLMHERMLRATQLHEITGAGHSPTITHPAQVIELMADFLPGCLPPERPSGS